MSKELVISANRHETKVAILEDDQLVELYFQRANEYSLAGSIHKGRVTRVLPGMQSAFVDLGLERDTFLYVSDFFEEHHDELDKVGGEERPSGRQARKDGRGEHRAAPPAEIVAPLVQEAEAEIEEEEAAEVSAEAEPAAAVADTTGPRREGRDRGDRDRRGRRGRRRGRRAPSAGNFPESKYASATDEGEEAAETTDVEVPAVQVAEVPPALPPTVFATPRSFPAAFATPEGTVLPGESLAKYRRQAPPPEPPVLAATASPVEVVTLELPAITDPASLSELPAEATETADLPEAPVAPEAPAAEAAVEAEERAVEPELPSAAAEAEAEQEVPLTQEASVEVVAASGTPDALETTAPVPYALLPPDVDPAEVEEAEAIDEAREELLTESEEEDEEIEAAQDAAEAALAEEEEDEEDLEPIEASPEFDDAADVEAGEPGKDGPEPVRQPQSLTAALRDRERSSRFQARGRRSRGRRRGPRERGSEIEAAPLAESAVTAPAVAAAAAPAERAPRAERAERVERPERSERPERGDRPPLPQITDLLKAGQEILVQIAKEPIGAKGARITSHIALPGRYCVYMPTVDHNGVSRKIDSDEERLRLKRILQTHRTGMPGGFIIRTAGEGQSEEEIAADMNFLYNLWLDIRAKAEKKPAPVLVHHDLDIVQRTLRDQLTTDYKTIWLDNEELYESTVNFVQRFQPALVSKVKLWTRPVPVFDAFNISSELEKALRPKVWLKSGGYIVINQTEALVAIDVNTGKYVGKSNKLEDTIVKTNTEAVKEIVRQIRLRDLGGIIVVDFIDMDERKNRQKVMQALEEAMQHDRAPYKILQFNDFGLVAITRKRVKQSLERALCQPCVYCDGSGTVKSVQTVIGEILSEAQKLAKAVDDKEVMLRVHPEVAKVLKSHKNQYLEELEGIFGKPVLVTGDASIHIEKYDLA